MRTLAEKWNNWGYKFYRKEYLRVVNIGCLIMVLSAIGIIISAIFEQGSFMLLSAFFLLFSTAVIITIRQVDEHEKKLSGK